MNEEQKQILEMLAQGKISAEDAERLLDKLQSSESSEAPPRGDVEQPGTLKYLRVLVDSTDGDKVNIRVPLALIRTGVKLAAVLPNDVNKTLGEKGVDLSKLGEMDAKELYETLNELQIDVDSGDGDTVRVFCE